MTGTLLLGAVAYDPKVVSIWEGFRAWMRSQDFDLDFVLYAHYERQVEDLLDGRIDVAWNSPLAWVRARRMAKARSVAVDAIAMRDTDRGLSSVVAVLTGSPAASLSDLAGLTVGTGAIDSPQASLLPLSLLRSAGLVPERDITVRRFDVGVGLHGDHIGGERDGALALRAGAVDAACLVDANLLRFATEGTLPSGSIRILGQTQPYDHCNMTSGPAADQDSVARLIELLLSMSYADSQVRPLLDLEGLKQWLPGRTSGYMQLERAVDEYGFYDSEGIIGATDYRP